MLLYSLFLSLSLSMSVSVPVPMLIYEGTCSFAEKGSDNGPAQAWRKAGFQAPVDQQG